MKTIYFILAVGLLLAACAEDHTSNTKTYELTATTLAGTEWVLTGYEKTQLPEELRNRSTIKFSIDPADDVFKVTGRSFINSYFGELKIDESTGSAVRISGIGATKMGGSQRDMNAEIFYFQNLDKVTSFRISENGQLLLYFGDNQEIGYFSKK